MILSNAFFWISCLSLVLIQISCTLLAYRFRHRSRLMIPLWIVTFGTIMILVHPLKYALITSAPIFSLLSLLSALLGGYVAWHFSYLGKQPGTITEQKVTRNLFVWSVIAGSMLLSYVIWRVKQIGR